MPHQIKYLVGVPLDSCIAHFVDAVGRDPAIIRMPRRVWEEQKEPALLFHTPVEPCDGRMYVLEG